MSKPEWVICENGAPITGTEDLIRHTIGGKVIDYVRWDHYDGAEAAAIEAGLMYILCDADIPLEFEPGLRPSERVTKLAQAFEAEQGKVRNLAWALDQRTAEYEAKANECIALIREVDRLRRVQTGGDW